MSEPEERPAERVLASLTAGVVIGVIEVVLASSFAAHAIEPMALVISSKPPIASSRSAMP